MQIHGNKPARKYVTMLKFFGGRRMDPFRTIKKVWNEHTTEDKYTTRFHNEKRKKKNYTFPQHRSFLKNQLQLMHVRLSNELHRKTWGSDCPKEAWRMHRA